MSSALTKEEVMQWRRSTEKITLEEFAQRLGKSVQYKKETNDLHDLFLQKKDIKEEIEQIKEIKKEMRPEPQQEAEEEEKSDIEIKVSFKKKLNKREETVFNYFCRNRNQKVTVTDLATMLDLPNDYVYKYIKNLRSKIIGNVLVNADQGGYIFNI